jgi:general secretion pathway protein G
MGGRGRGYTIIELLVVMAVLGVLATAAMPLAELSARRSKERELKQALSELRHAIDAYKAAYDGGHIVKQPGASGYPPTLQVLAAGVPDALQGGQAMYFLRRVPADPFAPPQATAEASWGLRSYASPPAQPRPGDDVYDVYSQSAQVGINGVPYAQW